MRLLQVSLMGPIQLYVHLLNGIQLQYPVQNKQKQLISATGKGNEAATTNVACGSPLQPEWFFLLSLSFFLPFLCLYSLNNKG